MQIHFVTSNNKINTQNKLLLKSVTKVKDILNEINFDNTILVLQGAGDIKNIINILNKENVYR